MNKIYDLHEDDMNYIMAITSDIMNKIISPDYSTRLYALAANIMSEIDNYCLASRSPQYCQDDTIVTMLPDKIIGLHLSMVYYTYKDRYERSLNERQAKELQYIMGKIKDVMDRFAACKIKH